MGKAVDMAAGTVGDMAMPVDKGMAADMTESEEDCTAEASTAGSGVGMESSRLDSMGSQERMGRRS